MTPYKLDSLVTNDLTTYAYKPTSTEKSVVAIENSGLARKLSKELPSSNNLDYLDHLTNGRMFNIAFGIREGNTNPTYVYDEFLSGTTKQITCKWNAPVYNYVENKNESSEIILAESGYDYSSSSKAKSAGQDRVNKGEFSQYSGVNVTTERKSFSYKYKYIIKGTTYKRYYSHTSGGEWYVSSSGPSSPLTPAINIDELRIYSGNSFTISLSDELDENGQKYSEAYEITKIKVYCSGNNLIRATDGISIEAMHINIPQKYHYARFVDSTLELPSTKNSPLSGMDYEGDFGDNNSAHIWSGLGRSSVTLVLADYFCEASFDIGYIWDNRDKFDLDNILKFVPYDYTYQLPEATDFSKYIVIDKIEVKCTKKSTASATEQ